MRFIPFLADRLIPLIVYFGSTILACLILNAFKVQYQIIIIVLTLNTFSAVFALFISYSRRKHFYDELKNNLNELDKKYMVIETLPEPSTYEDRIMVETLRDISKSMLETINEKQRNVNDYKEFIEMWIHEVKIPISSLVLKCHNNPGEFSKDFIAEVKRIENYVNLVLYYARSEDTSKDFLIKETNLREVVRNVLLQNMDALLAENFEIENKVDESIVYTDSKWLEFILNQIISNSIKYKKDNPKLTLFSKQEEDKTIIVIRDNGIGVLEKDIKRVFEKSFTGENGRKSVKSTGMGLYIVKNLCDKLGHKISIDSKVNEYTEINISFGNNTMHKF